MACTKEEIERKRLAALEKIKNKLPKSPIVQKHDMQSCHSSPNQGIKAGQFKITNSHNHTFHPYSKNEIKLPDPNAIPVTKVVTGTMYLISDDRFEVNPSEFCSPLINIFKSIPSKSYDAKSKLWNFSIQHYEELMSKVAPLAPHIVLGSLPQYVLKILREEDMDPNLIDLSPVESILRNKLMPFQEDGVRFAIARRGRCLIADDMGLGKTFQALAIASYYRRDWPLLIVTTSSMRQTWQSKIHELLPSVPMMNIVTLTTGKDAQMVADKQTEVVIVSYKITSMHADLLKNKKFGFIIIDESHNLKSPKAQCSTALAAVARGCARALLLSGTPALSRPAELYTQLALLQPKLFPSYTEYGKRYCAGKQTNFGWDMTGQSNLTELQIILQKKFLIRRTKDQVLPDLDEKTRETVYLDESLLEFSAEQRQGLNKMAAAYARSGGADRQAALLTFFSETANIKIPAVCKYIKQMVKEFKGKFLVFAHHRNVLDAICYTLDEVGVSYICIVGSTPAHARAELVHRFQSCAARGGVLSLTAAGAGLTLTAADLVIFAELHWNPGVLSQAECRAHRLGRAGAVRVRYLLAARSADDYMWPLLQRKLNVLNDVGLSKDTYEDTTVKHQESKTNITQYLSPSRAQNKNDYIPGTNIRKNTMNYSESTTNTTDTDSFMQDEEGDELLANLDF